MGFVIHTVCTLQVGTASATLPAASASDFSDGGPHRASSPASTSVLEGPSSSPASDKLEVDGEAGSSDSPSDPTTRAKLRVPMPRAVLSMYIESWESSRRVLRLADCRSMRKRETSTAVTLRRRSGL